MKRPTQIAFKLLAFVLAGAIINVAVAWGCSLWCNSCLRFDHFEECYREGGMIRNWRLDHWRLLAGDVYESERDADYRDPGYVCPNTNSPPIAVIPAWTGLRKALITDPPEFDYRIIDCRGWPMRSLWYEYLQVDDNAEDPFGVAGGIVVDMRGHLFPPHEQWDEVMFLHRYPCALPMRIIWPGFMMNSLFHAAIFWCLVALPFAMRRRWRIRRGMCSRCAYPAGSSPTCTECGAAMERMHV